MNEFIQKHHEFTLGVLTVLFLVLLVGIYAWGGLTLFASLMGATDTRFSPQSDVSFDLDGAEQLRLGQAPLPIETENVSLKSGAGTTTRQ